MKATRLSGLPLPPPRTTDQGAQKVPDARRKGNPSPTRSPPTRGLESSAATQQTALFQRPDIEHGRPGRGGREDEDNTVARPAPAPPRARALKKCRMQGAREIRVRRVVLPTRGLEFFAATQQTALFQHPDIEHGRPGRGGREDEDNTVARPAPAPPRARALKKCRMQGAREIRVRRVVLPTRGLEFSAATQQTALFQRPGKLLVHEPEEGIGKTGIEARAARGEDETHGARVRVGGLVAAGRAQGVVGVGQGHDAREERDV
ncbi:hypothetical protein dsx2_1684 [Desulfovibrio sp. X2]|nr:hypothetical protein dsx2_1684 [Desulfovibrio sp. X2]